MLTAFKSAAPSSANDTPKPGSAPSASASSAPPPPDVAITISDAKSAAQLSSPDRSNKAVSITSAVTCAAGSAVLVELGRQLVASRTDNTAAIAVFTTLLGTGTMLASGSKNFEAVNAALQELEKHGSKHSAKQVLANIGVVVPGALGSISLSSTTYYSFLALTGNVPFALVMALFTGFTRTIMGSRGMRIWFDNVKWFKRAMTEDDFRKRQEICGFLDAFAIRGKRISDNDLTKILNQCGQLQTAEQIDALLGFASEYGTVFTPIELCNKETAINLAGLVCGGIGSAAFYKGAKTALSGLDGAGFLSTLLGIIATSPIAALQSEAMKNAIRAFRQLQSIKDITSADILYTLVAVISNNPLVQLSISSADTLGSEMALASCIVAGLGITAMNKVTVQKYCGTLFGGNSHATLTATPQQEFAALITKAKKQINFCSQNELNRAHKASKNPFIVELNAIFSEAAADSKVMITKKS